MSPRIGRSPLVGLVDINPGGFERPFSRLELGAVPSIGLAWRWMISAVSALVVPDLTALHVMPTEVDIVIITVI
jgi:hypothetical protein